MTDIEASHPAAVGEGSGSLSNEQGASLDNLANVQMNGETQDVAMASQDEPDKISKSTEPQTMPSQVSTTQPAPCASHIVVLKYNADRASKIFKDAAVPGSTAPVPAHDAAGSVGSPARTSTPNASGRFKDDQQQGATTSRAPSAVPTERATIPAEAVENGAPTRVYLNQHVTQHLLDGMKLLALHKPADPLRMLGEFLLQRSDEQAAAAAGAKSALNTVAASQGDKDMNGVDQ
ncbi:hypothetical protein BD289DRAFT_483957 [Coniella lustricola]|uniref:Dpy-30 motif-domain-containing protein n=1 Tax=Coniella lustricola TaxID=2025994 RepID=A0A2T3A3M3_9PEZI|nr:hypothetical protein BD289DRAFT_483957 [Coniella lustricola]